MRSEIWVAASILTAMFPLLGAPQTGAEIFGGEYKDLQPKQKRLVDDWFQRFSKVVGKPVKPDAGYDGLPVSTRTTFNAVTHALLASPLTDESGKALAPTALDIVGRVDTVAGEVLGARGDLQFRLYVQMKPNAIEVLGKSREFRRSMDNTVYHRGYPVCFRSPGGAPSIQVSLTPDGTRADIDVDYRSSKIPQSLVNGHLTSSNSDVRANGNDRRHNQRWAGLQNWWQSLLGFPTDESLPVKIGGEALARQPRVKSGKAADAVGDFLSGWLVEQKPNVAIGYIAPAAFACREADTGKKIDRGMARFELLKEMMAVNKTLGKVVSLEAISVPVTFESERLRPLENPYVSAFSLYDVRSDLASELDCENRLGAAPGKAKKSREFGKHVGAIFRVRHQNRPGHVVATLWEKDKGLWKMTAYSLDPGLEAASVPNVATPPAPVSPLPVVEGDPEMVKAATAFLEAWWVKKDPAKAMTFVAPEALACVNLYAAEGAPPARTPSSQRAALRKAMLGAIIGSPKSLQEAIEASALNHPDLKLVRHENSDAFAIVSLPEYMGSAAACTRRAADDAAPVSPGNAGHGRYFATGFHIASAQGHPSELWTVWDKVKGEWKAVSYVLLAP